MTLPAQSDTVECPTCHGVPQMQGDGSGWDGGGSHHAPPCSTCGDRGTVPATPSQSSGPDLLTLKREAEREWLDAARAADIVREFAAERKAKYDALCDQFDAEIRGNR